MLWLNSMLLPSQERSLLDQVHAVGSLARWRDFVRENFPWLEIRGNDGAGTFDAEVQTHTLGGSVLATIRSARTEVHRTAQLADRAEAGFVKLMWQMSGSMEIEQDRRRSIVTPGEVCVCDTARPYRVSVAEGARFAVLTLPYEALPGWQRISQSVCGAVLPDKVTSAAALSALMTLTQTSVVGADEGADDVLRAVQWMLAASLRRCAVTAEGGTSDQGRIGRAQAYVLDHLADPNLNADELASALHMSRRALYLLFKEYRMTPGRLIHDLRLEHCHRLLSDTSQAQRSITEIAFDSGFQDTATFSRVFKAQYGLTPTEVRRRSLDARAAGKLADARFTIPAQR